MSGPSHISPSSKIKPSQKSSSSDVVGIPVGSVVSGSVVSGSVVSGSVVSGSVGIVVDVVVVVVPVIASIQSAKLCKEKPLKRVWIHSPGSVVVVVVVGSVVLVVEGPIVVDVVFEGPFVVVVVFEVPVVGQSTVKLGPQRFQPPEKEFEVVEVLYLHLTFCQLGTFTDPLSELPVATD